jgi:hypothetical protein
MDQWMTWAHVALTWAVRAMALVVALLFIRFLYRVITYKEPAEDRSGRATVFADAIETLRSGKPYQLKDASLFDGSDLKLRLFAESLSGQLKHPVGFDDISYATSGEVIFFTDVEETEVTEE